MTEPTNNQEEHELISTALDVERLDTNLYRSKCLWVPARARGVFGGQVISQALVSATQCVDPAYFLHSVHCYFLLSASPAVPIVYHVDRVRDGRSYTTRAVRAVQNGRAVFVMMCSFQRPEPWQPNMQHPMPVDVPGPAACSGIGAHYGDALRDPDLDPDVRKYYLEYLEERRKSPLEIRTAGIRTSDDGMQTFLYWFRVKNMPRYEPSFQKCVLSYLSDSNFIGTATKTLGLDRGRKKSLDTGMTSTLDHTIYYYDNTFDCGDWLLYVMNPISAGSGRAVVHGRIHTQSGKLVAVTSQEGVVRANIRGPSDGAGQKAKL